MYSPSSSKTLQKTYHVAGPVSDVMHLKPVPTTMRKTVQSTDILNPTK